MSPSLKKILGVGLLLVLLACAFDAIRLQGPKDRPNFTATDLDGRNWSLADYRGRHPVIVSFFSLT
jgi:hypothetical protein